MGPLVQWVAPAPLWEGILAGREQVAERLERPAILRFADDRFMDNFLALMERDPAALVDLRVHHETWRGPAAGPPMTAELHTPRPALVKRLVRIGLTAKARGESRGQASPGGTAGSTPAYELKLYQPGHQRYYLVTANLVCGLTGFPDRRIDAGRQERVGFVVRRLLPADAALLDPAKPLPSLDPEELEGWDEYAFVPGEPAGEWRKVAGPARSRQPGEEVLPMFPVGYSEADGRHRRLFAGLVPVGRREAYMGAVPRQASGAGSEAGPSDARWLLFQTRVTGPWSQLLERAAAARAMHSLQPNTTPSRDEPLANSPSALRASIKAVREQIQTVSWYVVADLGQLLAEHLPGVWRVVLGDADERTLSPKGKAVVAAITQATLHSTLQSQVRQAAKDASGRTAKVASSLAEALRAMAGREPSLETRSAETLSADLERVTISYVQDGPDPLWPTFLFPLADSEITGPLPPAAPGVSDNPNLLDHQFERINHCFDLLKAALSEQPVMSSPAPPLAARPGADMREGWFVLRCVFERPECAPGETAVVSALTVPFQMAGFFDPDAPARPVRIGLPIDTTPAGLRKFDKNTAFMISDVLCGQIQRMKGITLGDLVRSVLPWPLHKDLSVPDPGPCGKSIGVSLGMMCSLSIPIVTICALILLLIMVTILDYIFRWLPYFIVCFPLPGFKGKKDS